MLIRRSFTKERLFQKQPATDVLVRTSPCGCFWIEIIPRHFVCKLERPAKKNNNLKAVAKIYQKLSKVSKEWGIISEIYELLRTRTLYKIYHFLVVHAGQILLKAHSQVSDNFDNWKSFKNEEKCFLFHLKSSFDSQDISVFVLTFWSCIKMAQQCWFQILWRHSLVNKHLSYTCCPISREVKAIRK